MEVVVTIVAVKHAKLQSNCHGEQIDTQLLTGRMSPNQHRQSTAMQNAAFLTAKATSESKPAFEESANSIT